MLRERYFVRDVHEASEVCARDRTLDRREWAIAILRRTSLLRWVPGLDAEGWVRMRGEIVTINQNPDG